MIISVMMAANMWVVTTLLMLMIPCDLTISTQSSPASSQQNCSQPLGMEDGAIRDAQITASSSYQETLVGPEKETVIILSYHSLSYIHEKFAEQLGKIILFHGQNSNLESRFRTKCLISSMWK